MSANIKIIMDEEAVNRSLARLSHEIIEKNADKESVLLLGVYRRGVPLAKRIAANISKFSKLRVETGELDISLYRDDLSEIDEKASVSKTKIDSCIRGKTVIIVDDVIYTGRTARAAIDAIINLGRPQCIQLAVLIDRGHRELPIRGDYVGKNVPTSRSEKISVMLPEFDGKTGVAIISEN